MVISGKEDRFSGGADLDDLNGTIDDLLFDDELGLLTEQIQKSSLRIAAAVEGVCFGAAIDLAWACDMQVVSTTARFALPAVQIGILYNPISLARLHARIGSFLLRRLLILGEEVSGDDLGAAGVADAVAPGSAVQAAVDRLTGGPAASDALRTTKAVLASLDVGDFDPESWQQRRGELLASPGRSEVLQATKLRVKRNL